MVLNAVSSSLRLPNDGIIVCSFGLVMSIVLLVYCGVLLHQFSKATPRRFYVVAVLGSCLLIVSSLIMFGLNQTRAVILPKGVWFNVGYALPLTLATCGILSLIGYSAIISLRAHH